MKASHLFKWLLCCLLLSVFFTGLVFFGFRFLKPLVFVFVGLGAASVFVGVLLLASGLLEDDITQQRK